MQTSLLLGHLLPSVSEVSISSALMPGAMQQQPHSNWRQKLALAAPIAGRSRGTQAELNISPMVRNNKRAP